MRIALGVEYDGTSYCGWEIQKHCVSVQETLERALSAIANHPIRTVCAGRTDARVHAWGQVVHFETDALRDNDAWVRGTNARLDSSIAVRWAQPVAAQFHARFSARQRRYRYLIVNAHTRPALLHSRVAWERIALDHELMHQSAQALVGEHDFSGFRAAGCQAKSPIRTVHLLSVHRRGDAVSLDITANAFLQHMVRNIAGVLIAVGTGKAGPEWTAAVLRGRDRRLGGVTASPSGLYLVEVGYPEEFEIPSSAPSAGGGTLLW